MLLQNPNSRERGCCLGCCSCCSCSMINNLPVTTNDIVSRMTGRLNSVGGNVTNAPSPFRARSSSSSRPRQRHEESSSRQRTNSNNINERSKSTSRARFPDDSSHGSTSHQKSMHSNSNIHSSPRARPTSRQNGEQSQQLTHHHNHHRNSIESRSSSRARPTSRQRGDEESHSTNPNNNKNSIPSSNYSIGSSNSLLVRERAKDPPPSSSSPPSRARPASRQRAVGESPPGRLYHQDSSIRTTGSNNSRIHATSHASSAHDSTTGYGQQTPNKQLSWRSDPDSSFSDWTIEIIVRDSTTKSKSKTLYHCHSNVLAWGPRRSEAFVNLFQQRLLENSPDKVSSIELNSLEASAFPFLLDFLYCETQVPLSASKACALCLLADRFEIHSLQKAIETYVERALNLDQMIEFITCARQYNAGDKLVFFANSKLCGYLVKKPKEGGRVPPDVLAHVLHKRQQCMKVLKGEDPRRYSGDWEAKRSQLLSRVVGECVTQQYEKWQKQCDVGGAAALKTSPLTRQIFDRLTSKQYVPHIDTHAAIQLLKIDGLLGDHASRHLMDPSEVNMTCLQERCTQSIIRSWRILMRQCSKGSGGENDENNQDRGNKMHLEDEDEEEDPPFSLLSLSALSESLRQVAPHVLADMLVLTSLQYETSLAQERSMNHRPRDFYGGSKLGLHNPNGKPVDAIVIDETARPLSPLFMCGQVDDESFSSKRSQGPPKPEDNVPRRSLSRTGSSSTTRGEGGGPQRRQSIGAMRHGALFDESSIGINSTTDPLAPRKQKKGILNLRGF